jgi:hypothetical protein
MAAPYNWGIPIKHTYYIDTSETHRFPSERKTGISLNYTNKVKI